MINFNNVIIADSDCIYIDVSIKDLYYFTDCYINRVVINDIDSFETQGPNLDKCIYDSKVLDGDNKTFKALIKRAQFEQSVRNISNNIYFIYIQTKGTPTIDTPCGQDLEWYKVAIVDYKYLYHKSISYIRELVECKCSRPEKFMDFILRIKALEMCLISQDYEEAIRYFKKFFNFESCGKKSPHIRGCGCGCNG